MAGRCQLCDGRIVNGRCSECGMDYSRMKNRYHLNQDCDEYDSNAKRINAAYERTLQSVDEKLNSGNNKKTPEKKAKLFKSTDENDLVKKINARAAEERRRMNAPSGKNQKPKKNSGLGPLITVILVVAMIIWGVGSALGDGDDDYSDTYEFDSEVSSDIGSEESAVNVWDDESSDPSGFSDAGEWVSCSLVPGMYMVGTDIPAGIYDLTNTDEVNSVYVYVTAVRDGSLGQYYIEASDTASGVYLYDGDLLTIPQQGALDLTSDCGQMDSMHSYTEGEGDEMSLSLSIESDTDDHPSYMVGEDIEPGRYTVTYSAGADTSDMAAFATCVLTDMYGDAHDIALTFNENEDNSFQMILTEGDTLSVQEFGAEDGTLEFVPVDPEDGVFY